MPTDWKSYLKPEEAARLIEIKGEARALVEERRRIYARARKRMERDHGDR